MLRSHVGPLGEGRAYAGGNAALVEASLGLRGSEILYVGDHVYADVRASKDVLRWRTALILRPLEDEIAATDAFRPQQERLTALMDEKERLEAYASALRLERQRNVAGYGPQTDRPADALEADFHALRARLVDLDAPHRAARPRRLALVNERWGPLLRAGTDK